MGGISWECAKEGIRIDRKDANATTHRLNLRFFIAFLLWEYRVANRNWER
jgi:hypothetical protein